MPRREGMNRVYSHRDRGKLQLILRGKRVGLSLIEIKEILDLYSIDQRKAIYPELAAILGQGRPYLFLWSDRNAVVLSDRVRSTAGPIELNSPNYLYGVEMWYLEE